MVQNKMMQSRSSCDTDVRLCEMPISVEALFNGEELETSQTMFLKTSEGINERLGWLEYSLFLLDPAIIGNDPDGIFDPSLHIMTNLYKAFRDPEAVTLKLFNILHDFASTFPNAASTTMIGSGLQKFDDAKDFDVLALLADAFADKPLSDINFDILRDISDNNNAFYQYLQTLSGDNKVDAWFAEYLDLKEDVEGLDGLGDLDDINNSLNELRETVSDQSLAIKALAQFSTSVTSEISNLVHLLEESGALPMNAKNANGSDYISSIEESNENFLHTIDNLNHHTSIPSDILL